MLSVTVKLKASSNVGLYGISMQLLSAADPSPALPLVLEAAADIDAELMRR